MATINKNVILPHPFLAFLVKTDGLNLPITEIDYDTCLSILSLNSPTLPLVNKGWQLVSFKNVAMALVKHLGNRTNNYFPNNLKLRKMPSQTFSML